MVEYLRKPKYPIKTLKGQWVPYTMWDVRWWAYHQWSSKSYLYIENMVSACRDGAGVDWRAWQHHSNRGTAGI